jgi:hypothetical protein
VKKDIDRQTKAAGFCRFEQVQYSMQDGHLLVRGDYINTVRFNTHPVPDLKNLHHGGTLEQFMQEPLVCRVQVLDNDKGHAASLGYLPQELLQGFQPASRGAYADNGKYNSFLPQRGVFW